VASVAEVVAGLDNVLSKAREAVAHLQAAEQTWREYTAKLMALLAGSRQDEVRQLAGFAAVVTQLLDHARTAALAAIAHVEAYREQIAGTPAAPTAVPRVMSPARDQYPPEAAWAAHLIDQPYSEVYSRVPVVGIARVTGSTMIFEFRPGPGRWTDATKARMVSMKAKPWAFRTVGHVETQVVAWMIETGTTHVELVINREPCGERVPWGCHQVLSRFLPVGYRLVVSGTRGGNLYYSYNYDGKASL
jgi:hypothetical protein